MEELVTEILEPFKDGFQVGDLWDVLTSIMSHTETFQGLNTGKAKKAFALEMLAEVLNQVDLPGPDWLSRKVILWVAPSLIDKFVSMAKDKFSFGD